MDETDETAVPLEIMWVANSSIVIESIRKYWKLYSLSISLITCFANTAILDIVHCIVSTHRSTLGLKASKHHLRTMLHSSDRQSIALKKYLVARCRAACLLNLQSKATPVEYTKEIANQRLSKLILDGGIICLPDDILRDG